MSDCFDHAADAMDSYISCHEESGDYPKYIPLPDRILNIEKVIHITARAILVQTPRAKYWIPKSQVRKLEDSLILISGWFYQRLIPVKEE